MITIIVKTKSPRSWKITSSISRRPSDTEPLLKAAYHLPWSSVSHNRIIAGNDRNGHRRGPYRAAAIGAISTI